MNTNKLKTFATQARTKLRDGVAQRLHAYRFHPDGTVDEQPELQGGGATFQGGIVSVDFYNKWMSLYQAVQDKDIAQVAEEAAYTWFNRLVAIRIMERNGLTTPVLEFEHGNVRVPVIVAEARQGRIPEMDDDSHRKLDALLDDDSKTDEQFALLITAFCHSTPILRECFGRITDYTELLLPQDILADSGFVSMLNGADYIAPEDYKSPELIGWLYQFYISERKDEVMAKKGKYTPDEIPAATQIFTPNWIVKYMVQNTVGRIYLDNNPDAADELKPKWRYLVDNPDDGNADHVLHCDLAEMKVADLACGSGHILNECFDILFELYVTEGYSRRQAIENIFASNLTGIDIDTRAKQLATFALLLKACQKDPSFADAHAMPHVLDMPHVDNYTWQDLGGHLLCALDIRDWNPEIVNPELNECFKLMQHADSLGSIMKFDISSTTKEFIKTCISEQKRQQKYVENFAELFKGFELILALTEKYHAVVMNPPYMGNGHFDAFLTKYIKNNFEDGKADLMTVFMMRAIDISITKGYWSMINFMSWMFLSSFEKLRRNILDSQSIISLLHIGRGIFGSDFGTTSFVMRNQYQEGSFGEYRRLFTEQVQVRSIETIKDIFLSGSGKYRINQKDFLIIPGAPIAYWIKPVSIKHFKECPDLSSYASLKQGLTTTDNTKYVRNWHEISSNNFCIAATNREEAQQSGKKWFPFNKGGFKRYWYGNNDLVVNFQNDGQEIKNDVKRKYPYLKGNTDFVVKNQAFYFMRGLTWSAISYDLSFRFFENGFICADKGQGLYPHQADSIYYLQGLGNSVVASHYMSFISPTVDFNAGYVQKLPVIIVSNKDCINDLVKTNIEISRTDWDAHETSWDFKENELLRTFREETVLSGDNKQLHLIDVLLEYYKCHWAECFERLHANEEELNRQFIDIYGLQDELTPDVPLDEVTILQQGEISIENDEIVWHDDVLMKQFISYAVGCMMGRYSIDKPGLILANQGDGLAEYEAQVPDSRFEVDDDGIIPLMPSDTWFNDNATLRFKRFLETVFGEAMLNENLNCIEQALGKTIDAYFVKDFWKDHKKMYQNRPIYWLFSSKKGAFQCIAYVHRMDAFTAERIRSKYLLPHIEWLVGKAKELQDAPSLTAPERKQLDSLLKQIDECREYHDRLHTVADKQIAFDLDDGVVVNHAKFGDVLAKLK